MQPSVQGTQREVAGSSTLPFPEHCTVPGQRWDRLPQCDGHCCQPGAAAARSPANPMAQCASAPRTSVQVLGPLAHT